MQSLFAFYAIWLQRYEKKSKFANFPAKKNAFSTNILKFYKKSLFPLHFLFPITKNGMRNAHPTPLLLICSINEAYQLRYKLHR